MKNITFDEIYKTYYKDVYSAILAKTFRNEYLTQEITAMAFAKAFKNISKYDPKKSAIKTWLYNIAYRLLIDNSRLDAYKHKPLFFSQLSPESENGSEWKGENKLRYDIADKSIDIENEYDQNELSKRISEAISTLKETDQIIFNMFYFENKKYNEISEELNIPSHTVHNRLHVCKTKLKTILAEYKSKFNNNIKKTTTSINKKDDVYYVVETNEMYY
jgi:RNA polymerase sigma-70 factor (ECF subfamily)